MRKLTSKSISILIIGLLLYLSYMTYSNILALSDLMYDVNTSSTRIKNPNGRFIK